MKIIFSKHALRRLNERSFNKKIIKEIINNPSNLFYDTKQQSKVAIAIKEYNNKNRKVSVAFHQDAIGKIIVRTFHPETEKAIKNRIKAGRYIKI